MNNSILVSEKYRKIFLYTFIFLIPFENWNPIKGMGTFTLARIFGYFYFFFCLLNYKKLFTIKNNKGVKIIFYLYVLTIFNSIINYSGIYNEGVFQFYWLQNIILYLLLSNEFSNDAKVARNTLIIFLIGVVLLASLISIGIDQVVVDPIGKRITIFGMNQNSLGILMSLGIIIIMYIITDSSIIKYNIKFVFLAFVPSLMVIMIMTGSRGAFVGFIVSFLSLFMLKKAKLRIKILYLGLITITAYYIFQIMMNNRVLLDRILLAINYGQDGERTEIWSAVIDIWRGSPIIGVGSTGYAAKIISSGIVISPHNAFVEVLVYNGIIGLSIFLLFIYYLFISAIQDNLVNRSTIKVSLLLLTVINISFGQLFDVKIFWVLFAYITSSSITMSSNRRI